MFAPCLKKKSLQIFWKITVHSKGIEIKATLTFDLWVKIDAEKKNLKLKKN